MFKPMAATVLFALIGSLAIALLLMPVLSSYILRNQHAEKHTWLMRKATQWCEPFLKRTVRRLGWTAGIAVGIFVLSLLAIPFLGAVFIP